MKSLYVAIFSILYFSSEVKADYSPMRLSQMILDADSVVDARITRLDKKFFWVSAYEGGSETADLKVLRFKDWPCAKRWEQYRVGQRVLLFLKKEKDFYRILSAGGEGELPVVGDSLMVNAQCLPFKETWKVGEFGVRMDSLNALKRQFGKCIYSYKSVLALNEFKQAVFKLRSVYKWGQQAGAETAMIEDNGSGNDLYTLLRKEFVAQNAANTGLPK